MNIIDILIVVGLIAALFRGREVGFIRQFCSTAGFFAGLFIGALLQPYTVKWAHTETSIAIVTIATTLGSALLVMTLGEYAGIHLKRRIQTGRFNKTDMVFGSGIATLSLLALAWLGAAMFSSLPSAGLQKTIDQSRIVSRLNQILPPAPAVIASLSKLVDPNGFPQVFTGREPAPNSSDVTPSLAGFDPAIAADKASVVKLEGQGCGGIVEGSGFVIGDGLVATNAHVVAGIAKPYVLDDNGTHRAQAIWFDPDLDFAIVRTTNLAGPALQFNTQAQARNTKAAVLGYPGGGKLDVESAVILDQFKATGRNIYGQGETIRDIYEVKAKIIPGNSGGPLITADGSVIGVVFAQSTSYKSVGYTLTAKKVLAEINAAKQRNLAVSTSRCAE